MQVTPVSPTPFESPRAAPTPNLNRRAWLALAMIAAPAVGLGACLLMAGAWDRGGALIPYVMGASSAVGLAGVLLGGGTWVQMLRAGGWGTAGLVAAASAVVLGLFTSSAGALVSLLTVGGFTRGRQLRRRGRPLFAPIEAEATWVTAAPRAGAAAPAAIADAWRQNGLTEHASVASFGRLAIDLVALGAPPKLIEAAHRDALDEMRHTELCFSLARDLDGRALGPAAFPAVSTLSHRRGPRSISLASLAVESLIDGALNEGVSARVVAELAKEVAEPRVQSVLQQIARDEARHAAHGFDVVRWCLAAGGAPVAAALKGALQNLPGHPAELVDHGLDAEAWGLPNQARLERVYGETRDRLAVRTARLLRVAS